MASKKPSRYDYDSPMLYAQAMRRWQSANAPKATPKPKPSGPAPSRYDYDNPAQYAQAAARYRDGKPSKAAPAAPKLPDVKTAAKMKSGDTYKNGQVKIKPQEVKPSKPTESSTPQRKVAVRNPAPQQTSSTPSKPSSSPSTPSKLAESGYKAGDNYYRGSDAYKKALAEKNGGSSSGNPLLDKMRREMGRDAATGEKSSGPSMDKQKATAAGIVASGKVAALKPSEGSKNFSKDSGYKPETKSKSADYSESFKKKEDEKKKALMIKGYKK